MKIAISNIAWSQADEPAVAAVIQARGIAGIEVAPTMIWPDPIGVPPAEVKRFRTAWERRGVQIVAMQALLFGRNELRIFGTPDERAATVRYLKGVITLGARLGATALVFGSPKNRMRAGLPLDEANVIATSVFRQVGDAAERAGLYFCIEPNPPAYGCDYLTNVAETVAAVESFSHPRIRLHVDSGSMLLNEEPVEKMIRIGSDYMRHYHISEPYLAEPGTARVDHTAAAGALRAVGYKGWCSIEMKAGAGPGEERVDRALRFAQEVYGNEYPSGGAGPLRGERTEGA